MAVTVINALEIIQINVSDRERTFLHFEVFENPIGALVKASTVVKGRQRVDAGYRLLVVQCFPKSIGENHYKNEKSGVDDCPEGR